LAYYRSQLEKKHDKKTSKRIKRLTAKRNNKIKHYLHCVSKKIINHCLDNNIKNVILGKNDG
jgi:hypothetical protein